jgi:outer membrane protein TolC
MPAVLASALLAGCAGPLAPVTDRDAAALFRRPPSMDIASELRDVATDRRPPPGRDGAPADPAPPGPPGSPGPPRSSLAELISDAIARHPQVAADTEAWRRAVRRIGAVGLPHPSLSAEQARATLIDQRAEEAEKGDFEQEIPWPGAIDQLNAAWGPPVREAWYRLVLTRLAVTREVRSIVHELSGLEAALQLVEERLGELQPLARTAAARAAPDSEAFAAAVQDLQQRSQALRAMRPILLATLNTAMGRPGNAPLPATVAPPPLVAVAPAAALVRTARATNPTLLVLEDRREDERVRAAAARSLLLPRFTLGVQGVFISEPDDVNTPMGAEAPVRITFGVSVPLWNEHDNASVRGVVSRRLDIAGELVAARAALAAEVATIGDAHRDADRRATELERTVVPAARAAWREARETFVDRGGPPADVLAAHRALLEGELALVRARVERGVALARLEEAVGGSVATRLAGDERPPASIGMREPPR